MALFLLASCDTPAILASSSLACVDGFIGSADFCLSDFALWLFLSPPACRCLSLALALITSSSFSAS